MSKKIDIENRIMILSVTSTNLYKIRPGLKNINGIPASYELCSIFRIIPTNTGLLQIQFLILALAAVSNFISKRHFPQFQDTRNTMNFK